MTPARAVAVGGGLLAAAFCTGHAAGYVLAAWQYRRAGLTEWSRRHAAH